jgi:RNA polymerase sigma-70 factor (ECF subfamily)
MLPVRTSANLATAFDDRGMRGMSEGPRPTVRRTPGSGRTSVPDARIDPALAGRSDEDLFVAAREGDRDCLRALIERYREDLLRFLVRYVGSRSSADDVFQETFVQVWMAAETFDAERRFKPWLFTIAANKARDLLRRQKRRAATSLSAPVGGANSDATLVDLEPDRKSLLPGQPIADAETRANVKRVVDEMPAHYREILLLAYFQKMSYQQISESLSIPLGTVKSRLHAAVANFADAWRSSSRDPDMPE